MGQCSKASRSLIYSLRPSLIHRVDQALLVMLGTQREKKTQTLAQKAALCEGKERSVEKVAHQGGKCCDGGRHGPKQDNRGASSEPEKSDL